MSNDVTLFEGGQVPAHLNDVFGDEANMDVGSKINALSIKGKIFRIVYEGEEAPLMRHNEETGDDEPMSVVNLIVINQGPFGARDYFEKAYDGASSQAPDCFSIDGKVPHSLSQKPQSKTCATCPHAVKGSKMTPSGQPTTACQLKRRLAVVPAHKPEFPALLLKLAATSAYDPDTKNAENGWFGWRQYMDFLNARGVRHTAQLVTKVRFDPNAEYPKLLFKPERFLTEDEAKAIAPRIKSDEVSDLIMPPNDGVLAEPVEAVEPVKTAEPAKEEAAAAQPEPEPEKKPEKPKSKVTKEPKVDKKAETKAAEPEEEVQLEREKAVGQPSKEAPKTSEGINKLLDDWDV